MDTKNVQNRDKMTNTDKASKSYSDGSIPVKKELLGVGITSATKENILEYIIKNSRKSSKPYYVVTPNPEMIVTASHEKRLKEVVNGAKIALADGIGVVVGGWLLGKGPLVRYTGVDLVKNICERVNDQPITVGFLGGRSKVAEVTAECLLQEFPNLHVAFAAEEWGNEGFENAKKFQKGKALSDTKSIDILFVAFGVPKQEFWIEEHIGKIPVNVMVGVGGAFDYISGKVVRAPKVLQNLGLEWLFRLIVQPWRIKRQLALPVFAWMILKEKLLPSRVSLSHV